MRIIFFFALPALLLNCSTALSDVPFLIQQQSPDIQVSWNELDSLIRSNEQLTEPLAEPYFARAQLWTIAGSPEDAVRDYLAAIRLMKNNDGLSLVDRSELLSKLIGAVEQLERFPRKVFPARANESYKEGLRLLRTGQTSNSLFYFEEAVRMNPTDPVYRAVRAVTLKRLGRDREASEQVGAASGILRKSEAHLGNYGYPSHHLNGFYQRIEWLQGNERNWLQGKLAAASTSANVELRQALDTIHSSR